MCPRDSQILFSSRIKHNLFHRAVGAAICFADGKVALALDGIGQLCPVSVVLQADKHQICSESTVKQLWI